MGSGLRCVIKGWGTRHESTKALMKRVPFRILSSEESIFITLKLIVLFFKYSHRIFFYIHISNLMISIYTFLQYNTYSSLFPDVLQIWKNFHMFWILQRSQGRDIFEKGHFFVPYYFSRDEGKIPFLFFFLNRAIYFSSHDLIVLSQYSDTFFSFVFSFKFIFLWWIFTKQASIHHSNKDIFLKAKYQKIDIRSFFQWPVFAILNHRLSGDAQTWTKLL